MIAEMIHLKIIGLQKDSKDLIEHIRDLGVFHVEIEEAVEYRQIADEPMVEKMKFLRAGILGLLEDLSWNDWSSLPQDLVESLGNAVHLDDMAALDEIEKSLVEFKGRLSEMAHEIKALEESIFALKQVHYIANHFYNFFTEEKKRGKAISFWLVETDKISGLLKKLERKIRSATPVVERPYVNHKLLSQGENISIMALSVDQDKISAVHEIMDEFGCISYTMPKTVAGESTIESPMAAQMELKWLPERLERAKKTLDSTKEEWGPRLAALYILIDDRLESLILEKKLSSEGEIFTLTGWIPSSEFEKVKSSLKNRFGERVLITWRSPEPREWPKVPILLDNPRWAKPFELFLKLMPMPGYKSTDPTAFIAIFFPLFAGCMIGDIGYGLIFLLIGLFSLKAFRRKNPILKGVSQILINISVMSIIWGFLYGEFFGDLGHRLFHMEPLWVERTHGIIPVMGFTVSLGVAHVILGLALGAYEGVKYKNKHHTYERLGTLFTLLGIVLFVVGYFNLIELNLIPFVVALLVTGLALLIKGGNLSGFVETIGSVGNVLSYIRIAAIGLSSAILAMVATKFVDVLGVTFFGILLAVLIHLLNLIIAIAGSVLHSARLHYVEFFGKFYEGKGKQYRPIKRRRGTAWRKP